MFNIQNQDSLSESAPAPFVKLYKVSAYECDSECRLKTGTLLNWLQDSMDQYSQRSKINQDFLRQNNLSFILRGYDITINALPLWQNQVVMNTMITNTTPTTFFLQQDLYNLSLKSRLLSACSQIVLVNAEHFSPVRISHYLPPQVYSINRANRSAGLPNLQPLSQYPTEYIQPISYDHIDFNQHVNNANYVTFAERGISPLLLKKIRLKRIAVAYKQAAKLGEQLKVQTAVQQNSSEHQISSVANPNTVFARVHFAWDLPNTRAITR